MLSSTRRSEFKNFPDLIGERFVFAIKIFFQVQQQGFTNRHRILVLQRNRDAGVEVGTGLKVQCFYVRRIVNDEKMIENSIRKESLVDENAVLRNLKLHFVPATTEHQNNSRSDQHN